MRFASAVCLGIVLLSAGGLRAQDGTVGAPASIEAVDHAWDDGTQIDLSIGLSADDKAVEDGIFYVIEQSSEKDGDFAEIGRVTATPEEREAKKLAFAATELTTNEPYFYRVQAGAVGQTESEWVVTNEAVEPIRQFFLGSRFWMLIITAGISGSIIYFIGVARTGRPIKIREIAGLQAVDEAVGRATEMGRSCLFIPGIQDMNEIQTIAGITVLSRVAKTAAHYDAKVEVPTSRSLVMTAARETVQAAYLGAGRPDAFNQDLIYYVTDEQFGFVAYLSGMMVREKPAACFYMGAFFAESLVLAETGNSIGAIQIAGTAMPAQLPFFVAACDYTLIGEEFFAASAYLSGDADQLGSLKGQDVGKILVAGLLIVGSGLATIAEVTGSDWAASAVSYLKFTILQ